MSATANIQVHAGETIVLAVAVVDHTGAAKTVETATSATFTLILGSTTVTKTLASGITVSGSTATVTIAASETADVAAGTYDYQLYIVDASAVTACVVYGSILVTASLA